MTKQFDKKTILVILLLPLQFILQSMIKMLNIPKDSLLQSLLLLLLAVVIVSLVFLLRGDILKSDFKKFKEKKLKLLLISILSAIISAIIVNYAKKFIVSSSLMPLSIPESDFTELPNGLIMLIGSIVPTLAPFLEEVVFRHELFYRFNSSKLRSFIFAILSSILFGLLHYYNYSGNIALTIPLMLVGLFYCIIYKLTDNIWTSIFAHMFYNGALSIGASIFIIIMQLFT